jgi:hypothetical protein
MEGMFSKYAKGSFHALIYELLQTLSSPFESPDPGVSNKLLGLRIGRIFAEA